MWLRKHGRVYSAGSPVDTGEIALYVYSAGSPVDTGEIALYKNYSLLLLLLSVSGKELLRKMYLLPH